LGTEIEISKISVGFLDVQSYWIFHPLEIEFAISVDGVKFYTAQTVFREELKPDETRAITDFSISIKNEPCQYIRFKAKSVKICPTWHKSAGGKAWIFADELIVE